jgi:ribosomal protein L32
MTRAPAAPRRDGPREGSGTCPLCTGPLPSTRARYCSRACQQQAYRLRHRPETATPLVALRQDLQHRRALVAHTLYECPRCGERFVGERRCSDCGLFGRALGLGGHCPDCDQPILLADLLGKEVMPTL